MILSPFGKRSRIASNSLGILRISTVWIMVSLISSLVLLFPAFIDTSAWGLGLFDAMFAPFVFLKVHFAQAGTESLRHQLTTRPSCIEPNPDRRGPRHERATINTLVFLVEMTLAQQSGGCQLRNRCHPAPCHSCSAWSRSARKRALSGWMRRSWFRWNKAAPRSVCALLNSASRSCQLMTSCSEI